jgi:hypothetical protein
MRIKKRYGCLSFLNANPTSYLLGISNCGILDLRNTHIKSKFLPRYLATGITERLQSPRKGGLVSLSTS